MPRGASSQPFGEAHEGYLIVNADGDVDLCSDYPVYVAIVVDVQGYGPHTGSMFVQQENRYHHKGSDGALEQAYEAHEEWMREHYGDHLKELEKDRLKEHVKEYLDSHPDAEREEAVAEVQDEAYQEAEEWFRETMDGVWWKLTSKEFVEGIAAWPDSKSRKVVVDGITVEKDCD